MTQKVCIVQPRLHQYRVPFYRKLKEYLDHGQVECVLIHGEADPEERKRDDEGHLDWAVRIRNHVVRVGGIELFWQPCLHLLRGADLIIVQQENRMLLNYLLILKRCFTGRGGAPKLGFWGHGVNCQADSRASLRERWKRALIRRPDWWFAYTDFTRQILTQEHFPEDRITVVQNAIDTTELRAHDRTITDAEVRAWRNRLGIRGERVGVYCGSLHRGKRIDFLIDAARKIRAAVPDFELVVIGSGPDSPLVDEAAAHEHWIHPLGSRFGRDKALALRLGQVFLMPKHVGLAILDAFVLGLPLVTTRDGRHSPEIVYLRHGQNGCMTVDSPEAFASEVASLLGDSARLSRLRRNCLQDASHYTIEAMAGNFAQGIFNCLENQAQVHESLSVAWSTPDSPLLANTARRGTLRP